MSSKPVFVGIAGASGSGKSQLALHCIEALGADAAMLSLDSYYRVLDHLPLEQRHAMNFDHPDSLDWDLIIEHLDTLASGVAIKEPVYLFDRHTRSHTEFRLIEPRRYVLVEGILALHHADVRRRMSLRAYVETPDELCFERRLERDVVERGRTPESVRSQYELTVRPMAAQYVWPSKWWADIVVAGTGGFDLSVTTVLNAIRKAEQ